MTLVDQDQIGWKSWNGKPNTFAPRSPKAIHLRPGEHGEIWGRLEVGLEKVACWSTKVAISLKRVQIEENYYGGPIGTYQLTIRTKAHEKFWRKGSVDVSRDCPFSVNPYYPRKG